jgi:hypothetical protein
LGHSAQTNGGPLTEIQFLKQKALKQKAKQNSTAVTALPLIYGDSGISFAILTNAHLRDQFSEHNQFSKEPLPDQNHVSRAMIGKGAPFERF